MGAAKQWVEEKFPTATGNIKAMLILTYGAGFDAGMAEAQQIIIEAQDVFAEAMQKAGKS